MFFVKSPLKHAYFVLLCFLSGITCVLRDAHHHRTLSRQKAGSQFHDTATDGTERSTPKAIPGIWMEKIVGCYCDSVDFYALSRIIYYSNFHNY